MSLTILERLSSEKPCGGMSHVKNKSLTVIYSLVRKHMEEIEEARRLGYSWKQIEAACQATWQMPTQAAGIVWWKTEHMISFCYRTLKRGISSLSKANTPPTMKYSIEITKA